MDLTESSETSAIINQTPGNYPKESLLQVRLLSKVTDVETRKSHIGYFASLIYLKNN